MPRLKALTNDEAGPQARELLQSVENKLGKAPNIMRAMANAPAVLDAYLGFSAALAKGSLPARLREQIALAVGEANGCEYCVSAHSALGRAAGLRDEEIAESRRGRAPDKQAAAALVFARRVVQQRGRVGDADVAALRAAGYHDGAIAEIVANVAVNIFTNYFNHVADTQVDFPQVRALEPAATCAC